MPDSERPSTVNATMKSAAATRPSRVVSKPSP
jgi:hypothetical protein